MGKVCALPPTCPAFHMPFPPTAMPYCLSPALPLTCPSPHLRHVPCRPPTCPAPGAMHKRASAVHGRARAMHGRAGPTLCTCGAVHKRAIAMHGLGQSCALVGYLPCLSPALPSTCLPTHCVVRRCSQQCVGRCLEVQVSRIDVLP